MERLAKTVDEFLCGDYPWVFYEHYIQNSVGCNERDLNAFRLVHPAVLPNCPRQIQLLR
jgi:hypothetical protein